MTTVLAVLNQKGGAGKTTLSTNIARKLLLDGERVLLVDSDPQGSARDWSAASDGHCLTVVGLDRPTLDKDLTQVKEGYDWIIIDGAPQIQQMAASAIKAADLVLIPVQPSPYDIWACSDLVELIKTRQQVTDGEPKAAFVISRAIKNTLLGNEIRQALTEYGLPMLINQTVQRQIYARSAAEGLTPMDAEPNGEATKEISALVREIKNFIAGGVVHVVNG